MEQAIPAIFALTYLGMAVGRVPGLRIDRSGIAVTAAVILLAIGAIGTAEIGQFVNLPTLLLLFGMMIVSAQFARAGFYDWVAGKLASAAGPPKHLLFLVVVVTGALSALLANDIIAFAVAPILAAGIKRRGLDPRPFLIALGCACNAGSAMTVIGNPQNILIGQVAHLDFWRFIAICAPVGLVALGIAYFVIAWQWRHELDHSVKPHRMAPVKPDRWQVGKGTVAAAVLVALFAAPHVPREIAALAVAAALLVSRQISSRDLIGRVDWGLLLMIACLFLVTGAFTSLGLAKEGIDWLEAHALLPTQLAVMAPLLLALGNTISNVPGVMLILSVWHDPPAGAMYAMALISTLSGNFVVVGSLANIIVSERAAEAGVRLGFADHARTGIPVTLASIAIAVLWLWATGLMPLL